VFTWFSVKPDNSAMGFIEVIYQYGFQATPDNHFTAHNHFPTLYKTITHNSVDSVRLARA